MKLIKSLGIWMDLSIENLMTLANDAINELSNLLNGHDHLEKIKIDVRPADNQFQSIKAKWLQKHQNQ